jgi:glycogen operon protein
MRDIEYEQQRVGLTDMLKQANLTWHGVKFDQPDWGDNSRSVGLLGELRQEGLVYYLILNAYWEPLDFELPKANSGTWRRWIDTALESPNDIVHWKESPSVSGDTYRVADRSVVMLVSSSKGAA